jgi:protease I
MKKILMLTGDFAEDYETMVPFQMLKMVGLEVHAVCPGKNKGDTIVTAIHDFEGHQTYTEKPGHHFALTYSFSDIKLSDYDGLVIVGGRAPEYLRLNNDVLDMVKFFMSNNLPVAAICHGIQIITAACTIQGRKLTAYPAVKPEVILAGAEFVETEIDGVVVDGNLITSPAWPAHPKFIAAFLKLLGVQIIVEADEEVQTAP